MQSVARCPKALPGCTIQLNDTVGDKTVLYRRYMTFQKQGSPADRWRMHILARRDSNGSLGERFAQLNQGSIAVNWRTPGALLGTCPPGHKGSSTAVVRFTDKWPLDFTALIGTHTLARISRHTMSADASP